MRLIENIGEPAMLEQLAEECVELAHAALKLARVERGEIMGCSWYSAEKFEVKEGIKFQRMMERLEASNGSKGVSGK